MNNFEKTIIFFYIYWKKYIVMEKKILSYKLFCESVINENQSPEILETIGGTYVTLEKYANGIKFTITEEGKELLEEEYADGGMPSFGVDGNIPESVFWDMFEDIESNSEYMFIEDMGAAGFGLTEAPGILDGYYLADNGNKFITDYPESAEIYWYPDYMVKNFLIELKETGETFFTKDRN